MMVTGFVLLALVVAVLRYRSRRRATLSGLNGERPVFSVAPPTRRLSGRRWDAL